MMKTKRVAILMMIMLGFVQILNIEAKLPCPAECALACFASELPYPECFAKCIAKCNNGSTIAFNCISNCGVNKSVTINIGISSLITFTSL
ncbi:hypothetical protein PHAVU_011G082900 [Phaseolus vulgaris]|uniref:Uncharacterized protein n=1 Tax=Phaseolus vulgaris TaxID=3885 RepID=V7AJM1_PHAVU|nr:hypothetical protein PHAVU_011G082900g [Phaseolus vulgaris]ESW04291.1 hypothetical protein PHAVU_011G082900g [Phaseolus vulgaris]